MATLVKLIRTLMLLASMFAKLWLNAEVVSFDGFQLFENAKVNSVNSSLVLDSSAIENEFAWRRYAITKQAYLFKFDDAYKITFRAKVEGFGDKAFLHVVVRAADDYTGSSDIARLNVKPTDGKIQDCEIGFCVAEKMDYRLQFHSYNRVKADITDVKIEKIPQNSRFISPDTVKNEELADISKQDLPHGAKEFEVELPRIEEERIINAADYGLDETASDNTVALRKAIEALRNTGANKLVINKGNYRFCTNNPISFSCLKDATIDGCGATFINMLPTVFVKVDDSDHVRIVNLNLDYDWNNDPIASLVEVIEQTEDYTDLHFIHYDDFPKKDTSFITCSPYDMTTKSVGCEGGRTVTLSNMGGERKPFDGEWLTLNTARLKGSYPLKVGEYYRLQHYYYHGEGLSMCNSKDIRLEHVNIYSCTGAALCMSGTSSHVLLNRVNIAAPANDPRRVITCSSDHFHIAQSRGFIKMENCEFSLGGDDIFNMHDNSGFGRRDGDYSILTENANWYGNIKNGTKIEVRHSDYAPAAVLTLKATERIKPENGIYRLSFEEKVPEQLKDGFVLFDKTYDTHNIIVRNCLFHDNRARGLLILARDVTVENNVFRHQEMEAIKIETGYTLNAWSEGYGVSNVVIRNNLFENINPSGSDSKYRQPSIWTGIYTHSGDNTDYPIISGLVFDHNLFLNSCGVAMYLSSVHDVTLINNMFKDNVSRRDNMPYRAQIYLKGVHNIKIYNNHYRKSDYVVNPGVHYDIDTCSGIDIENLTVR